MRGFSLAPLRLCVRRLTAITVALSFIAFLVPIVSASRDKSNTMPCCVGKATGHCDSGLTPKRIPQPKSEPMCGLENSELEEDDGITIVAEPSHNESPHALSQTDGISSSAPAAEFASLSQPCQMECGTCATTSSRQQRRERGVVQPAAYQTSSLTTRLIYENLSFLFSSNDDSEQASPRGPPSDLR